MSLCINQSNTTWNVLLTSNSTRWSPMVMGRWTQPTNFDLLPPAKGAFMLFRQPRVQLGPVAPCTAHVRPNSRERRLGALSDRVKIRANRAASSR